MFNFLKCSKSDIDNIQVEEGNIILCRTSDTSNTAALYIDTKHPNTGKVTRFSIGGGSGGSDIDISALDGKTVLSLNT